MKIKHFIPTLFSLILHSCAAIVTNYQVQPIYNFPKKISIQKSVSIRAYMRSDYMSEKRRQSVSISRLDPKIEDRVLDLFKKTGIFSDIKLLQLNSSSIISNENNLHILNNILDTQRSNTLTDYFVDIVFTDEKKFDHFDFNKLLSVPSFITFGFIPVKYSKTPITKFYVYKKLGNQQYTDSISDIVEIWKWTPLVFHSKAKILSPSALIEEENLIFAVQNLLQNSFKNGAFD